MEHYRIVIKKIERSRHYGLGYEIRVLKLMNGKSFTDLGFAWSWTLWGARIAARKKIREDKLPTEIKSIIEDYSL